MRPIHLSIKTKLILYFLVSILLPATLVSVIFYTRSSEIITGKLSLSIAKNLSSVESILLQKLDSVNDYSVLITLNTELQNIISSPQPHDDEDIVNEIVQLDKILDSYYLADFSALTQAALYPKIYVMNRPKYAGIQMTDRVYDIGAIESEAWYADLPNQQTIVGVNRLAVHGKTVETLRLVRKLVALRSADMAPFAAVLTTDIDTQYFIHLLANYKETSGSSVSLLDTGGQVLLSSDPELRGRPQTLDQELSPDRLEEMQRQKSTFGIRSIGGRKMLVSTNYIDSLKWTVLSLTPLHEVNLEQRNLNSAMMIVILVCMLFALFVALVLSGSISRPILALVKSMSTIEDGNFAIKLNYRRQDEFGILIGQYRKMMENIKDLVERLYVSEVNKKEAELKAKDAELKALQAQINPHFLYNTLDSINLYAMKHNVPFISSMVGSLSNFFRYGLSKGQNVITLQDERKHVESYLEIQKMRLGDKLVYEIDFPDDTLKCLIAKLSLQPLVENAIIHGIQNVERPGLIRISAARQGSALQIRIADNGAGGDIDEMREMLDAGSAGSSTSRAFGTRNVNERIKRLFGTKFGVSFRANAEGGLTATIDIPALRTMEGYHADDDLG